MSYSFEAKLAAIEHDLSLRQWWLVASQGVKAYKPDDQFRHIAVLEEIARDYRRAIARRSEPVNADNMRVVRTAENA